MNLKTEDNLFSDREGTNTKELFHYIGGLQTYLPDAMLLFAPYVNSYRRFVIDASDTSSSKVWHKLHIVAQALA